MDRTGRSRFDQPLVWIALGIVLVMESVPVAILGFLWAADWSCDPSDCYGENGLIPIVVLLILLFVGLIAGTELVGRGASHRPRISRWLGAVLTVAALPLGVLLTLTIVDRYCPSGGCSSDYMVMGITALFVAALAAIATAVIGIRQIVLGRSRVDPDRPPDHA